VIALKIKPGNCFDIFALEIDGSCEVLDFLNLMGAEAHPSLVKLVKDIDRTADVGLMRNRQRFRVFEAEIYEFRTFEEVRLLCFLGGRGILVLTNGFTKQQANVGIDRAAELKRRYFDAKRNGYLTYRDAFL
jgi:hypothetical protein